MRQDWRQRVAHATATLVLLGSMLGVAGCSSAGGVGVSNTGSDPAAPTGTVEVMLEDPTHHYTPDSVADQRLEFVGVDENLQLCYGPVVADFSPSVILAGVPVQTFSIVATDPDDPTVAGEAPVEVLPGQLAYVTDMVLLPVGDEGPPALREGVSLKPPPIGPPLKAGAGYIQTRRATTSIANSSPVMAGTNALSYTGTLRWPYPTNTWLSPLFVADNRSSIYLGEVGGVYQKQTLFQERIYPKPWCIWYKNDRSRLPPTTPDSEFGLFLGPELLQVTKGAHVPAPEGPGVNSPEHLSEIQSILGIKPIKLDPGFEAYAAKVHRIGEYDADILLRAADSKNSASFPKDAALKMGVVRGNPFLYFTAVKLPRITFTNFGNQPPFRNVSGTVDLNGTLIGYNVLSGGYAGYSPPDFRQKITTVLFWKNSAATYTPDPNVFSTLTFHDATATNYFAVCLVPHVEGASDAQVKQLAERLAPAAFSYPANSTVSYSYNAAGGFVEATYTLTTQNVLGLPEKSVSGLLPNHYDPNPYGDMVLQGSPAAFQDALGQPMRFPTVRGDVKVYDTSTWVCRYPFVGLLPYMPALDANDTTGRTELGRWVAAYIRQHSFAKPPYTAMDQGKGQDAYTLGKFLQRNVTAANPVSDVANDQATASTIRTQTRAALERYFQQTPGFSTEAPNGGQAPYYVYYEPRLGTLMQYPNLLAGNKEAPSDDQNPPFDGFGANTRLNDHMFHYGYFVHTAAQLALRDPAWGTQWKDAINQMVFDVANDPSVNPNPLLDFPTMRNWDPYENHCYAAGLTYADPYGNNEESISEEINFWAGVILWGAATNQPALMEHGIKYYTAAVHSSWVLWMDPTDRYRQMITAIAGAGWSINWPGKGIHRVMDAYARLDTFFGIHPAAGRMIVLIPMSPASFYHAMDKAYVQQRMADYDAFVTHFEIDPLNPKGQPTYSEANPWLAGYLKFYSILSRYYALTDPQNALTRYYNVEPDFDHFGPDGKTIPFLRQTDEGDSGLFVYHFVRYLQTHGRPNTQIVPTNSPFGMVFEDTGNNLRTYVAYNHQDAPATVTFSNGTSISNIPARSIGTTTGPIL